MLDHPLAHILAGADGLVVVGDSSDGRFPAFSYHAYTHAQKRFYCLDLGGLSESRGPTKGGKVYTSIAELPADRADLAVLWVKPSRAVEAVKIAAEAGCRRVWFSFQTGTPEAVAVARSLGLTVVEVGRCPVYYLEGAPIACRAHTQLTRLSGTWARPPQTEAGEGRRELL